MGQEIDRSDDMIHYQTPPNMYVPAATRQWATSALILAIIYFLFSVPSIFQMPKTLALMGSKSALYIISLVLNWITCISFVVTSAATIQARSWGREALSYTAAFAIVVSVFGCILGLSTLHDPHYQAAMLNLMTARQASGASLPASTAVSMMGWIMTLTVWVTVIGVIIQVVYCGLLYRHMSQDAEPPVSAPTYGGTPGAWPPPPTM